MSNPMFALAITLLFFTGLALWVPCLDAVARFTARLAANTSKRPLTDDLVVEAAGTREIAR